MDAVLQVLLEAPQYHGGYFEGLLATHGLHLTGVYMGPAMDPLLADLQTRRKPAVFYGYHPSEVQNRPGLFSRCFVSFRRGMLFYERLL
jgi:hypothetical protein